MNVASSILQLLFTDYQWEICFNNKINQLILLLPPTNTSEQIPRYNTNHNHHPKLHKPKLLHCHIRATLPRRRWRESIKETRPRDIDRYLVASRIISRGAGPVHALGVDRINERVTLPGRVTSPFSLSRPTPASLCSPGNGESTRARWTCGGATRRSRGGGRVLGVLSFLEQTNRCSLPVLHPCNEFNVSPGPAVAPAVVAVAVGRRPTPTARPRRTPSHPRTPYRRVSALFSVYLSGGVPPATPARGADRWRKINASVFVLAPLDRRGGNFRSQLSRDAAARAPSSLSAGSKGMASACRGRV